MKNLKEVAIICMQELDKIGIPYREVEDFIINTRAKSRWGQCKTLPNGKFLISISNRLLEDDTDIMGLKNTIIHELIHTCKGCMNHKSEWKMYAQKVNNAYGYNIKRTSSAEDKGVRAIEKIRVINHKYICEGCGQIVTRERDRGFEKRYNCGVCGKHFIKVF